MEELNNPAARFHALLKKGQSKGKEEQCVNVWRELLQVPGNDTPLLLRRIGYVWELPRLIQDEIRELPDVNHDIYLKWLPRVNASITLVNFQNPWKTFIDRFDAEILYGIEICADALSRNRPEKTLSDSTLKDLSEKLSALLEEFSAQDFPASIAKFIRQRLEEIHSALEEYPYRGSSPLESVVENTFGKVVVSPEIYKESQNSNFGKKFWEYMGYVAVTVTVTTGAMQIGKDVVSLLPPAGRPAIVEKAPASNPEEQHENSTVGNVNEPTGT